jgi:hypothetical protein
VAYLRAVTRHYLRTLKADTDTVSRETWQQCHNPGRYTPNTSLQYPLCQPHSIIIQQVSLVAFTSEVMSSNISRDTDNSDPGVTGLLSVPKGEYRDNTSADSRQLPLTFITVNNSVIILSFIPTFKAS